MSAETISSLERGIRKTPYPATVALLSEALELSQADRALLERAAVRRSRLKPAVVVETAAAKDPSTALQGAASGAVANPARVAGPRLLPDLRDTWPFLLLAAAVGLVPTAIGLALHPSVALSAGSGLAASSNVTGQHLAFVHSGAFNMLDGDGQRSVDDDALVTRAAIEFLESNLSLGRLKRISGMPVVVETGLQSDDGRSLQAGCRQSGAIGYWQIILGAFDTYARRAVRLSSGVKIVRVESVQATLSLLTCTGVRLISVPIASSRSREPDRKSRFGAPVDVVDASQDVRELLDDAERGTIGIDSPSPWAAPSTWARHIVRLK